MKPRCAHGGCESDVNDDHYCHGCRAYICDGHSTNPDTRPGHAVEEHWQEPDDE